MQRGYKKAKWGGRTRKLFSHPHSPFPISLHPFVFFALFAVFASCPSFAQRHDSQIPGPQQEDSLIKVDPPASADLPLEPLRRVEFEKVMRERDYKRAETILVEEAEGDPKSLRAAKLLTKAGGIFFLDGQYLNAAIAYKKADAIAPLDERSRFTMAMSYVKLDRRDWAKPELEKLASLDPKNALYLYWLARLDYDAQRYNTAIAGFQKVIELDPRMMRAYDNLGLCYDYLGKYDDAIASYNHAVELNRGQAHPSPWPHVNLAISLMAVNRLNEAENHLRMAIAYDARLPQAHYQLGRALEKQGKYDDATESLKKAAALDPNYPEPHYVLSRIYQREGKIEEAKKSIERLQQLKKAKTP
ncbi:MAG: tetratricopeptide repeat protein [Chloracidobacterium sp.]|nr:tetratricopeptide repeat protein [Chloracidobacterium sp.]